MCRYLSPGVGDQCPRLCGEGEQCRVWYMGDSSPVQAGDPSLCTYQSVPHKAGGQISTGEEGVEV